MPRWPTPRRAYHAPAQEQKPASTLNELRQRLADCIGQPQYAAAIWGSKIMFLNKAVVLLGSFTGRTTE